MKYFEIEQMRQSPYVKEKKLENGISSFNFTRKAFWDRHWTKLTMQARGLFVDTVHNKIKARSFDKFFAIGERPETQLDILLENFEYPVRAYVKYNGYLGICAGEPTEDGHYRLWCASKSTDQGWYAARFEDLLRTALGNRMERFAKDLCESGLSAVFEVIDPKQDPHIIKYDTPHVVLLGLIFNDEDLDFYMKSDAVVEFYNATWKLPYRECAAELWTPQDVKDFYEKVTAPGYKYNGEYIEGFVFQDLDDHMVKVKTDYYDYWKWVRTCISRLRKGQDVKLNPRINLKGHDDYLDMLFWINGMAEYHYNMFGKDIDIIEFRDFWERRKLAMEEFE